jgi:hypothetical protein
VGCCREVKVGVGQVFVWRIDHIELETSDKMPSWKAAWVGSTGLLGECTVRRMWSDWLGQDQTITLLKPLTNKQLLTPYEQFFIQSLGSTGRLIPEQNTGETNLLFQLAFKNTPHPDPTVFIVSKHVLFICDGD